MTHIRHEKKEMVPHTRAINYHLKSEVSITLHYQLCSTHYTTLQIKNCLKSTSTIKVATTKIRTISVIMRGSHHMLLPNLHLLLSAKMNGKQRRTLASPRRMHCTYCGMPRGTCLAEVMSNSNKVKSIAIVVIELHLSEGISQSVSRKFRLIIKKNS